MLSNQAADPANVILARPLVIANGFHPCRDRLSCRARQYLEIPVRRRRERRRCIRARLPALRRVIGMPVMMSEILIGRRGRRNPIATMALAGPGRGQVGNWRWVGGMGVIAGILILSYYSVIGGWTLSYVLRARRAFSSAGAPRSPRVRDGFIGSWQKVALYHTIFMALTIFVVARGVERGLEQAVRFMVPALLLLMLVLLGYSINSGYFRRGSCIHVYAGLQQADLG